jgi:hypothetical protein
MNELNYSSINLKFKIRNVVSMPFNKNADTIVLPFRTYFNLDEGTMEIDKKEF